MPQHGAVHTSGTQASVRWAEAAETRLDGLRDCRLLPVLWSVDSRDMSGGGSSSGSPGEPAAGGGLGDAAVARGRRALPGERGGIRLLAAGLEGRRASGAAAAMNAFLTSGLPTAGARWA